VVAAAFAAEGYNVIGGTGGWDYLAVAPYAGRVYASHGTLVEVVDTIGGEGDRSYYPIARHRLGA